MFIANTWYVAAWSHEVAPDALFSRVITGTPIVMYRKDDGTLVALEDRCCHRGAPLSAGRREGDCVRCMYHGLKFDSAGACIEAPAQQRIPPRAKVKSYPIVERHRWIWIWMGDPALANPDAIPDTHWLDDPAWRSLPGYIHYDVNYLLICDNLLDFSHLPFVHPTTLGGSEDYASVQPKVERIDNGVRVTRWTINTDAPAYAAAVKEWPGKVDRWNIYDFTLPAILLMDSGMAPTGTGARDGIRIDAAEFRGCQALTPETENSTHYFFSHPHNFAIDRPEVTRSIHQSVVDAFDEDRDIITAQQKNLALDPAFEMMPFGIDSALSQFRWVVNRRLEEESRMRQQPAKEA
ncbi:aromatic ring-hydroxylating dioxygenase subunit alpha [Burkholderia multivorans]|uniref:aromatic ring-hydroxylating dioxygenase subunit alpha n=1 Tax=Burkholderia multivorans TaxID=87883 RepID=UPI000755F2A1|nr:aromatic ring-hydroxylating dioxygenase subunit alpha [Burkholderia multivorans]AYY57634.1 aromatic ring-hydroxylating dioxygenase subunit alpha [Burkholderia multivorans]KWF66059.1 LysR family transcriptional regulator [Burkholderia multivorans]KWF80667.1 LysR family transcriptional regulator [Burkholderia multivorans]MCA8436518.1 aromatic ring-hydroxylating dioxygenase subunit alpha [Burkholderia multivorans]MDN7970092.1 aromatic ring-hydroxylating dioxygenase subunit alpha [Burkholderia 